MRRFERRVNRFVDRRIWPQLKSERISELCGKFNGFADFENTADRGSAANFVSDFGLCLSRSSDRGS